MGSILKPAVLRVLKIPKWRRVSCQQFVVVSLRRLKMFQPAVSGTVWCVPSGWRLSGFLAPYAFSSFPVLILCLHRLIWLRQWLKQMGFTPQRSGKFIFPFTLPNNKIVLIRACGRCQTGSLDTQHKTDLDNSHGRLGPWRTNIISWSCEFGLHSKRVSIRQGHRGRLQRYVRIQVFCWSQGKTTGASGTPCRNNILLVWWHEKSRKKCVERCCELAKQTTQQLYTVAACMDDH